MSNHQHLQARVMRFLVLYEGLVITACIAGGALLTFGQGGSLSAATPLSLVAAAELLRIPVAAFSTSVDRFGRVLAFIIMAAIAVISFDALALIFEQYIDNRAAAVLKAQRAYDLALDELSIKKADVAKLQASADQAKAAVTAADAAIANTENNTPPQPAPSGLSCGKNRSTCPVDRKARDDFHKAQVAYLAALKQQRADKNGSIVIAVVGDGFTLKRLRLKNGRTILQAENPAFPDIDVTGDPTFEIWGVVARSIRIY